MGKAVKTLHLLTMIFVCGTTRRGEKKQGVGTLGGINRKIGSSPSEFPGPIANVKDLIRLLNKLLEDVWGWPENSEKRAKTILSIGYLFKDLIPISDQETRLTVLEELMAVKDDAAYARN
jgi:hypothetical protein